MGISIIHQNHFVFKCIAIVFLIEFIDIVIAIAILFLIAIVIAIEIAIVFEATF